MAGAERHRLTWAGGDGQTAGVEGVEGVRWSRGVRPGAPGSRATRLELFYDLVFVFAFINVTTLAADNPTARGLVQCLIVLALLWWAWTGFAVLGNVVRTDQGILPFVAFATMAGAFVFALAMPQAFHSEAGGLPGPLVFAVCYFLVRAVQVAIFGWLARGDRELRRRFLFVMGRGLIVAALVLAAALVPQRLAGEPGEFGVRLVLWIAALAVEYGAALALRGSGWTVLSAGHWAERHAQIVLVALGETIIALGLGAGFVIDLPLTWLVIIAATLGVVVVAALWWAYFDTLALAMEQALHRTRDRLARAVLARDAYTYLHLPLVAGPILFALGLKRMLGGAAAPATPAGSVLPGFDLLVLHGGVALYLLALVALGWRVLRVVRWPTIAGTALLAALVPVAARVPELVALGALTVAVLATTAVQTLVDAPLRRRVREVALAEQLAVEAEQTTWRGRHL
ncbi:low temperature requirement protein A [Micromonospora sp. WMMD1082]|uniref:low temperature requirement protein A n=1 Tax=Micromonospora sp. WMMD1082 TaxID=3016104 RepID=UPI002417D413|nr:low temperature requirement protein A [Micromonospora sp. WMMD1082]MDG4796595.1 low temperature requirement protein A [Micromonospora sp. WMMD1082]